MNTAVLLTISRIFLAPLFIYVFINADNNIPYLWGALVIAGVCELSDAFDGIVARKYNQVSDLGKILDPLADSMYRLSCFVAFLLTSHLSVWMFLVFLYRDSLVSTLRILTASKQVILAARTSGKLKAIVQAISIFGVILTLLSQQYKINLPWSYENIIFGFMAAAVAITLYSLIDYVGSNRKIIKSLM
jgi:CDP-diacylglycerol--glycerol-3-phosphate 3-phosphatidyltransferase